MRIDYDFLRRIMYAIEDYPRHSIELRKLLTSLKIVNTAGAIDEEMLDKFVGHVKILADKDFIKCSDTQGNFGFNMNVNGDYIITNPLYRITAQGYDFIDLLRNDTAFGSIKNTDRINNIVFTHEISC